jgi:ABC-type branched-subunit amino acid transport system ATPase component
MLALLTALKPGHAILLVEHDMDAVFRVADRITVMVNGRVIASDVPEKIRVDPAGARGLSRRRALRMAALLTLTDLHARYGDSHVLRGVSLEIPAGVSLGLLGATAWARRP